MDIDYWFGLLWKPINTVDQIQKGSNLIKIQQRIKMSVSYKDIVQNQNNTIKSGTA